MSAWTWLRISRSSVSASGGLDAAGERTQDDDRGELGGRAGAGAAEAAAAVEQLAERQPTQLVAESVGGGHDHAAQLHERNSAGIDRGSPGQQQQPQRLLMLARARSCPTLVREGRASGTDCVELVVFAAQPPLAAAGAVDLMHLFAALALKVPDKPGAVVAAALDRPEASAGRVPIREGDGVRVAARAGGRRRLRDHRAGVRVDDRERVLVAMSIDADHVVHLLCKHSTDPPTRRVRYAGLEQGNRAAGL